MQNAILSVCQNSPSATAAHVRVATAASALSALLLDAGYARINGSRCTTRMLDVLGKRDLVLIEDYAIAD